MDKYGDELCRMFRFAVEIARDQGYLDDYIGDFCDEHGMSNKEFDELFDGAIDEYFGR